MNAVGAVFQPLFELVSSSLLLYKPLTISESIPGTLWTQDSDHIGPPPREVLLLLLVVSLCSVPGLDLPDAAAPINSHTPFQLPGGVY